MKREGFWVFGYGSLLWQPGFEFAENQIARLSGYARSFCMRSIHHRGTEEKPGLVLALDEDTAANCDGIAFYVAHDHADKTLTYLRERELISSAYLEVTRRVDLRDGRRVDALCYVIDPDHNQYCGGLPLEEQARIIAMAVGGRGPNTEYLHNTTSHLVELGLEDPNLSWLTDRVRTLTTAAVK